MGRIPPSIDLIEILYAMGAMSMGEVHAQVPDRREAWTAIGHLVANRIAALWVSEDGAARRLEQWEINALLRARLHDSGEPAPQHATLALRAGERIKEAYHRDFGNWYERELENQ
jgi:hypothetical protein